jgi:hypothetical protein
VREDNFGAHDGTTVPPKVLLSGERRRGAACIALHTPSVCGGRVSLGAFLIDFGGERARRGALLGWHFAALPPNVVSAVDLPHCSHDLAYSPKSHPPRRSPQKAARRLPLLT